MKQYSQRLATVLLAVLAMTYQPLASAASTTYGFYNITHNNAAAEADGEANLTVEVIDLGTQVQFKFFNNSGSSLTDVYFDDGSLLGIASISDSGTGVAFTQYASPGDLPGGNSISPSFQTTAGFSADSDPAVSPNGVTQGEWMAITFDLISGKTYADTIAALNGASDLRIGVHVQSYPGSESFINNPVPVPEAETYAMMLVGLGLVGWAARRRKQSC